MAGDKRSQKDIAGGSHGHYIAGASRPRGMTGKERKLILASSLGTVFEWYDFWIEA